MDAFGASFFDENGTEYRVGTLADIATLSFIQRLLYYYGRGRSHLNKLNEVSSYL